MATAAENSPQEAMDFQDFSPIVSQPFESEERNSVVEIEGSCHRRLHDRVC